MMKHILSAVTLTLAPLVVKAGDPCPIEFQIHDLGAPHWLDHAALLSGLESQSGWLGMGYSVADDGLLLHEVQRGGAMEAAGIRAGGKILQINGETATIESLANLHPDRPLQMVIHNQNQVREFTVTPLPRDPVPIEIVQALSEQECRTARVARPQTYYETIVPLMYDTNRRFRCDDAHVALESTAGRNHGEIYILRGSRRIILSMPGWGTTCFEASALDGANLTQENALAIIAPLIADYVADRHANP